MIEDFIIDCDNEFIRRKYRESVCAAWHGVYASQAPLFREYLSLLLKKYEVFCSWHRALIVKSGLYRGVKKVEKPVDVKKEDQLAIYTDNVQEKIIESLNQELGVNFDDLENEQFRNLQQSITKFQRLPRVGETIIYRTKRSCVITDLTFNDQKHMVAVCFFKDIGKNVLFKIENLKLRATGLWHRENVFWLETIDDFFTYLQKITGSVMQVVLFHKHQYILDKTKWLFSSSLHRVTNKGTATDLKLENRGLWFMTKSSRNAIIQVSMIHFAVYWYFDIWEYIQATVLGQNILTTVEAINLSLPLGQRSYVNAITGVIVNTENERSYLTQVYDGVVSMKDSASATVAAVVNTTTEMVRNIFYASSIIASLLLIKKFLE
jgi:hypothetical protein